MARETVPSSHGFARLALTLLFTLLLPNTAKAQVAPPLGTYGFVLNVSFANPPTQGGAALLGLMDFDGAGNVVGAYTFEIGSGGAGTPGDITGTLTGTYSVNANGIGAITGTLDFPPPYPSANVTLAMVIDSAGRNIELVNTQCSGWLCSGDVASGVAQPVFNGAPRRLRTSSLHASYGLQATKTAPTPQTGIGVWTFDGAGNITQTETSVSPGLTVGSGTLTGTYHVNSDGTGTITIPPQAGQPAGKTFLFVTTNSRSGLLVMQTHRAGDGVVYAIGHRQ